MNKLAIFLALALFAGCQVSAQLIDPLTPLQGGLLSLFALPFILNGGQFNSGAGILPPPIVGPAPPMIGGGPVIGE